MAERDERLRQIRERAATAQRIARERQRYATEALNGARSMRADAADVRLRLWQHRLAVAAQSSRDATLHCAIDGALSIASADYGNCQWGLREGRLAIVAQRGFASPFLDHFAVVDDSRTACGLALRLGRPIVVDDVADSAVFAETDALEVILDAGVRSVISVPLVNGPRTVGVLSVHSRHPRSYDERMVKRLQAFAADAAPLLAKI